MAHQAPWNKFIVEEFIREVTLTEKVLEYESSNTLFCCTLKHSHRTAQGYA